MTFTHTKRHINRPTRRRNDKEKYKYLKKNPQLMYHFPLSKMRCIYYMMNQLATYISPNIIEAFNLILSWTIYTLNRIGDSIPPCFIPFDTRNEEVTMFPQRICIFWVEYQHTNIFIINKGTCLSVMKSTYLIIVSLLLSMYRLASSKIKFTTTSPLCAGLSNIVLIRLLLRSKLCMCKTLSY